MHSVTRGHFWSRGKDGGHTIGSAISENPILHANFIALCFIERDLLRITGIRIVNHFAPVTFTLTL